MGNQQDKAECADLAWLAGFLDGEGSFMVIMLAGKRLRELEGEYLQPRICVVNTDDGTLAEVQQVLTEHHLPFHVSKRAAKMGANGVTWNASWDVRVQGLKRCKVWCETLLPYLRTKRSSAEAMLELCNSRLDAGVMKGGTSKGYREREYALIDALRKRPRHPQRLHARPAS